MAADEAVTTTDLGLFSVLAGAFSRWWLILIFSLLGGGLGYSYFYFMPKEYTAQATVFISPDSRVTEASVRIQLDNYIRASVPSFIRTVNGSEVLTDVSEEVQLPMDDLSEMVSAEAAANSVAIDVKVVDTDPARAAVVADATADSFAKFIENTLASDSPVDSDDEDDPKTASASIQARVTNHAIVPRSPSHPVLLNSLAIGLAVGFLIGFFFGFLRWASVTFGGVAKMLAASRESHRSFETLEGMSESEVAMLASIGAQVVSGRFSETALSASSALIPIRDRIASANSADPPWQLQSGSVRPAPAVNPTEHRHAEKPEASERRSAELRSAEPRSAELRSAEYRSAEPRTAEPRSAEPRSAERRGTERRPELRPSDSRSDYRSAAQRSVPGERPAPEYRPSTASTEYRPEYKPPRASELRTSADKSRTSDYPDPRWEQSRPEPEPRTEPRTRPEPRTDIRRQDQIPRSRRPETYIKSAPSSLTSALHPARGSGRDSWRARPEPREEPPADDVR